jgi:aspartate 1-decarboxylase
MTSRSKETPMLRTFVSGKIHRLRVSALNPMYNGSCLICPDLLAAAGIQPFEKVEIYSLTSVARIATYVFPGAAKGEFALNGGAAFTSESAMKWASLPIVARNTSAVPTV